MPEFTDYEIVLPTAGDRIVESILALEAKILPIIANHLNDIDLDEAKQILNTVLVPQMQVVFMASGLLGVLDDALSAGDNAITWEYIGPVLRELRKRIAVSQNLKLHETLTDEAPDGEQTDGDPPTTDTSGE